MVEMTIYPETGYGSSLLSDIWSEPLVFSESDDNQKQTLTNIIVEGFDFDYERGYEYTFKAKKVWMNDPPQDVSSIKYVFVGPLSKKKTITENSQQELELIISSKTVRFTPNYPREYENEQLIVYDALLANEAGTNSLLVLREIEGFSFEEGYEYVLRVKKELKANPYAVKYILLAVKDKQIK
ncbi:MAG: DUF4377 domain-containing protein [Tannerellaceae bacterium]|nr:DUF4377 domain-containing protein [Tannerellaceae bacterium]